MRRIEASGGSFPLLQNMKQPLGAQVKTTAHPELTDQVLLVSNSDVLAVLPEIPVF